jgi:intein/homing endonuclease
MKYGKLITFFYEERLIDEETFNKLGLKQNYQKYIIKKLNDNWGRSKGGINSKGRTKEIKIPKKNKELAELWGIMLGDGHLQKIQGYKLGVYGIDIAGHSIDDREYLINFVKPLIERLFNTNSRIYESKRSNCIHVIIDSRKIVDFFEENEFKAGNKIVNNVGIPNWIKKNPNLLKGCLRGLFDTDGSFYKLTNQNSYQVNFCNKNQRLLKEVNKGLLELGIGVSKVICNKTMVITKKSEIEKFYKVIGFSNSKHLNKIKKLF